MAGTTIVRARHPPHAARPVRARRRASRSTRTAALAFDDGGRITALGEFARVRREHPGCRAARRPRRASPPGARGHPCALVPARDHRRDGARAARLAARAHPARGGAGRRPRPTRARLARDFIRGLAASGTTTALVFGSHFPEAQDAFFEEAAASGLRIASGLVVSDRDLLPELRAIAGGRLRGRRARSARALARARPPPLRGHAALLDLLLGGHARGLRRAGGRARRRARDEPPEREPRRGAAPWRTCFAWADDYLETYERHGLVGPGRCSRTTSMRPTPSWRGWRAAGRASPTARSTTPSSAAGIFPMRRHLDHGVRFGLGTDVGAGTGLSMLKEGLVAYQAQMLASRRRPAHARPTCSGSPRAPARMRSASAMWSATSARQGRRLRAAAAAPGGTLEATLARAETPGARARRAVRARARGQRRRGARSGRTRLAREPQATCTLAPMSLPRSETSSSSATSSRTACGSSARRSRATTPAASCCWSACSRAPSSSSPT